MPTLDVNGVQLAYEELGHGPITVVTAQQDFSPDSFARLLPGPPTNYHVFAIHLRKLSRTDEGPGEDAKPRWYARWSADVAAAIRAIGVEKPVYTGISHGGAIGWHLAVEHPDLLRALVAINDSLKGIDGRFYEDPVFQPPSDNDELESFDKQFTYKESRHL